MLVIETIDFADCKGRRIGRIQGCSPKVFVDACVGPEEHVGSSRPAPSGSVGAYLRDQQQVEVFHALSNAVEVVLGKSIASSRSCQTLRLLPKNLSRTSLLVQSCSKPIEVGLVLRAIGYDTPGVYPACPHLDRLGTSNSFCVPYPVRSPRRGTRCATNLRGLQRRRGGDCVDVRVRSTQECRTSNCRLAH